MTRGLRQAIVLSILLHLALLFSVRQSIWLPEPAGNSVSNSISVSLRPTERLQQAGLPSEHLVPSDEQRHNNTRELLKSRVGERASPILPGFPQSTATDNVAVLDRAVAIPARPVTAPAAASVQPESVSLDGVRQYRLNLAREARQSKVYPDLARERGWEGVVVVVVTTVAGMPLPQVTLSQSSGIELLDRAATELVELAVRTARMPESLRGQQFALTLPIHYQLAD